MYRLFLIPLLFVGGVGSSAFAQDGPRVVKLTVSPAPPSASPMPYPLLPHLREIKPGNAAVFYERSQSLEWWGPHVRKEIDKAIETLEKPWQADNAKKFIWVDAAGPLKEIDYAARCETCDWQMLERLRAEGMWLLVPDMQAMRSLGGLNSVRIRSAIYQGDFDKAARGLQTSLTMAKQVGESPFLIAYLVGEALTNVAQTRLEEWVGQPDAPSLFWALTDLPHPLIDWRRPMQGEAVIVDEMMPEIRHALLEDKPEPIPVPTLQNKIKKFVEVGHLHANFLEWALVIAEAEPQARAYFTKKGIGPENIDRLPVTQLVLMYLLAQHDQISAEYLSLQNLPYWQAHPFLKKQRGTWEERNRKPHHWLQDLFLPTYESLFRTRARIERNFALLRHIEALRLYAAQHQGQWPESLNDLRDLPLPVDPYTGKAFSYRREQDKAILEAFAPPGFAPNETNSVRYELTFRSQKTPK